MLHRQQQFVGDASHQLRTPLTSLRLAVDNLRPYLPEGRARAEHAEALQEISDLARLLDGLLVLTRLGATSQAEPCALDTVLAEAIPGWQDRCRAGGMELVLDIEEDCWITVPPDGLRSLLDELVENAVRLSGGDLVEVSAHREERGDDHPMVLLRVRDNGAGMDSAERTTATQRFWRSPQAQNIPGNGLGLAIVAELAEACGGRVDVVDAEPGLAVEVRLPGAGLAAVRRSPPDSVRRSITASLLKACDRGATAGPPDADGPPRWRSPS